MRYIKVLFQHGCPRTVSNLAVAYPGASADAGARSPWAKDTAGMCHLGGPSGDACYRGGPRDRSRGAQGVQAPHPLSRLDCALFTPWLRMRALSAQRSCSRLARARERQGWHVSPPSHTAPLIWSSPWLHSPQAGAGEIPQSPGMEETQLVCTEPT